MNPAAPFRCAGGLGAVPPGVLVERDGSGVVMRSRAIGARRIGVDIVTMRVCVECASVCRVERLSVRWSGGWAGSVDAFDLTRIGEVPKKSEQDGSKRRGFEERAR